MNPTPRTDALLERHNFDGRDANTHHEEAIDHAKQLEHELAEAAQTHRDQLAACRSVCAQLRGALVDCVNELGSDPPDEAVDAAARVALGVSEPRALDVIAKARAVVEVLDWGLGAGYDSPEDDRMLGDVKARITALAATLPPVQEFTK